MESGGTFQGFQGTGDEDWNILLDGDTVLWPDAEEGSGGDIRCAFPKFAFLCAELIRGGVDSRP